MPLIYRRTSLFDSPAQTLVNTVNCVGVMGKGLAKEFKTREPSMYRAYRELCDANRLSPGTLWLWRGKASWVLNFPTKEHWRNPSKLEWIEAGLSKFVSSYADLGITDISFPRLGCGNGDLDWDKVRPLMESFLGGLDIPVYIHDFSKEIGLPEHLEEVAEVLKSENWGSTSFDDFIGALTRSLILSKGQSYLLSSGKAFSAVIEERRLGVVGDSQCSWLEEDDLRGIWIALEGGLMTSRKAGWAVSGVGDQVLSLMSVLPYVKPVEIQRPAGKPEIALERRFSLPSLLKSEGERQGQLQWG